MTSSATSRAPCSSWNAKRSSSFTSGGSSPRLGSLQFAYQEGPAQFDDELVNYRTLFTKLSWVF